MARKLNIQTFLLQVQGLAAMAERSPQPLRPARLFLRALLSPAAKPRGLTIGIAAQKPHDKPSPVSITHLKATTAPSASAG